MSSTPRLTLTLRVNLDGLVPDPHEFEPRLAHYGTFGDTRYGHLVPLTTAQETGQADVVLAAFSLPPFKELRGDETIILPVLPKTRLSGIPELDATQKDYVTYTDQAGMVTVPLSLLLRACIQEQPVQATFVDAILQHSTYTAAEERAMSEFRAMRTEAEVHHKQQELESAATATATKGQLQSLRVTSQGTSPVELRRYADRLDALVARSETDMSSPLLFGTQRFARALAESEQIIAKHYCQAFVGEKATYPNAMDSLMQQLHLPFYVSSFGTTLPVAFFSPRHLPRLQVSGSNINTNPLYQQTDKSLRFYEQCATSALANAGLSPEGTIRIVEAQHANLTTDAIDPLYYRVLKGIVKLQQLFANAMLYKSDRRVPNAKMGEGSGTSPTLKARRFLVFGSSKDRQVVELDQESFDDLGRAGLSNAADCEDVGKLCGEVEAEILPLTSTVLTAERAAQSRLLGALASVYERYDTVCNGTSVTTPFLDTTVQGEKPKMSELKNGHVPARLFSRVYMRALLKRGGYDVDTRIPTYMHRLGSTVVAPWEYRLPAVLTSEGTGPGNALVRPSVEVHPSVYTANVASRKVLHALPTLGGGAAGKTMSVLARTFRPEQLPRFDDSPANVSDRIDDFYLGDFHVISPRLFQLDARLAHLALVDLKTKSHGVDFTRLVRDTPVGGDDSMALVAPYLGATDAEMATLVDVAAVVKNMQPATSMGRFPGASTTPHSVLADYETSCLRLGHPLSDASFAALSHFPLPKKPSEAKWASLVHALDNHSMGIRRRATSFGALHVETGGSTGIAAHLDKPDRTIYCMYAPAWQVANADMEQLQREIQELHSTGLVMGHAIWRDRVLNQCTDIITLAFVVPLPV